MLGLKRPEATASSPPGPITAKAFLRTSRLAVHRTLRRGLLQLRLLAVSSLTGAEPGPLALKLSLSRPRSREHQRPDLVLLSEIMSVLRLCLIALLWATLALTALPGLHAFAGQTNTPEKTAPQGQDPPGADNGQPQSPPTADKEVIPPPPIGDEDIHTQAPNPEAGHEEEVIPPPAPTPDNE
jgi:hypothetical protein